MKSNKMKSNNLPLRIGLGAALLGAVAMTTSPAVALPDCNDASLPTHTALTTAIDALAPDSAVNGGLNTEMWATIVDRDGKVCNVAFSGGDRGDQWPGSRVISAQKANTANSFSLPGLALSTANLWAATQPGGSLFGLQFSNPVDPAVAYGNPSNAGGKANNYGTPDDPLVGRFVGGVNVFGGGLALYDSGGTLLGALGVSGDTSCADHNVAWRLRDALGLDFVPAGVGAPGDNIIYDAVVDAATGHALSAAGFGHPICGFGGAGANAAIVAACPISDGTTGTCTAL